MKTHSFVASISYSFLVAALSVALPRAAHAQLVAGTNVNIVGGPACSNDPTNPFYKPNCPAKVFGDLTIQRQNEGSMDCSSRNAANCLGAGNDYRLIGVTGPQDGKVTGDAWLGIYWTHNGGTTWRSSLLPGWKTAGPDGIFGTPDDFVDNTPAGLASPISGLEAAADATVRAGANGLFYVSGVAFNRAGEQNGAGVIGKTGVMFVSTFIDDNDTSDPNHGPRYVRTTIVDSGTSGQFLDKPWIAVDIPRNGAAYGNVYVAYSTFLGSGNNAHTDIWVRSSTDGGATFSNATKLTASIPLGQSAILAIAPNGDLWAAWREFGLNGNSDKIWAARSTNAGKMFSKAVVVADLGVPTSTTPSNSYDPETLPSDTVPNLREARSHDFPALCVGSDSIARVAFAKRNANGWARIMMATASTPSSWSGLTAIDDYAGAGHQFQPTLACTGTQTTAAWYDERNDNAFTLGNLPYVLTPFIIDPEPPPPVHTIDVRAAQTPKNGGAFEPSIQVSHYPIRYNAPNSPAFLQLKYNFLNLPLFGGGKLPFIGDYIDILAKNKFTPPLGTSGWAFNDYANETANLNVVWTDNRDVLQISSLEGDNNQAIAGSVNQINFQAFAAPGTAACTAPSLTVTRNQNLYTALLGRGLLAQVDGNARRTPSLLLRAYVVALYNFARPAAGPDGLFGTADDVKRKRFKLSFVSGSGPASFGFDPQTFALDTQATQQFVDLNSFAGTSRTVFLPKDSTATVIVQVTEVDANGGAIANGLQARTTIAPDPNAPTQPLPDEDHTASLEQVFFNDGQNPPFTTLTYTPLKISSDTILGNENLFSSINLGDINLGDINLGDINLGDINLGDINLGDINLGDINLGDINLGDINLGDINLGDINLGDINLGDTPIATKTVLTTTNNGNVDASYDLNALIQNLPANGVMQVLVSRLLTVPTPENCAEIGNRAVLRTLSSVSSTTGITSSSFSLPPGGVGVITLQATCNGHDNPNGCFTDANLSAIVKQQAPNCTSTGCTPLDTNTNIIDHAPPLLTLPANITTPATGASGAVVTFAATANDFVSGATTPTCTPASGSTFQIGTATVNCSATDAAGNIATGSFTVTVTNAPPVANGQSVSTNEDQSTAVTLIGSDVENEPLTYNVVNGPAHGSLTGTAPNLTYTPAANYNGGDSFTFTVNDGADSLPATVSITVIAVNDAPVASGQSVATNEDTALVIALTGSDVETPANALTFTVGVPAHGTLSGTAPNLTYTPSLNYNGPDSFTFTVTDTGDGASAALTSAPATVSITVNSVNDAPVANNQAVAVAEDSSVGITLSAADVESGSLTYSIVAGPGHGSLIGTPPSVTYTPAANYSGPDSFAFKANDGSADSNVATVSITVTPVNDPPVANADTVSTPVIAGATVNIAVLANDTDVDNAPSTLTVGAITTAPAHGTATISADGKSINYTANGTFAGSDSFQYTAKDPAGAQSAAATVTLTDNLGFNGLLSPYKANQLNTGNLGGAFPIVWQYTNSSNQVIDSSGVQPMLYVKFSEVVGANANTCAGGTETGQVLLNQDFPGNSNFQYFTAANPHPTAGANTWQFNWKLISPVTAGCWRARVILDLNGNGTVGDAGDQVNTPAGFLIKVK